MKVEGALWKLFYNDEEYWKEYFHDDTLILFDGVEVDEYDNPNPDAVVKIESGYVYQGNYESQVSLESFFRKWKKKQTTTVIVVTVEKDYADSVRDEIDRLDGVVGIK